MRQLNMQPLFDQAHKVEDASEETFDLFALVQQDGADLGMLAPKQDTLDLTIGQLELTVTQSPGLLQSANAQGTTGAAVWQSGVRLARWFADPQCLLMEQLASDCSVVELGCGVSGVVSSVLATKLSKTAQILVTDMPYAMRGLKVNLQAHRASTLRRKQDAAIVQSAAMDWETDIASSVLKGHGLVGGADLIIACDCIYNYALIRPFLDTCWTICSMRDASSGSATVCLNVQQLRQPDVLEEWLYFALELFHVWRLPAGVVGEELCEERGYVVYLLVAR